LISSAVGIAHAAGKFIHHHPYLIHPSLDRPHSPSQPASGSNQPFWCSTHSRQTDRMDRRHGFSDTANNNTNHNICGAVIMAQSHCESSLGSFGECRLSARWLPTFRPSQPTWAVSLLIVPVPCIVVPVVKHQSINHLISEANHRIKKSKNQ